MLIFLEVLKNLNIFATRPWIESRGPDMLGCL